MMFRIFNLKNFLFSSLLLMICNISYANPLINKSGYSYYPEKLKNTANHSYNNNSILINPDQWTLAKHSDLLGSGEYIWHGDNFTGAWKLIQKFVKIKPGEGVVVAVLGTGYTPHPNFKDNLLPLEPYGKEYGYDFISDCRLRVSDEGACPVNTDPKLTYRNPRKNAFDYGDYLKYSEIENSNGLFQGFGSSSSFWYGTRMIGAIANTGYVPGLKTNTLAGGAYGAKIVPIRILGKGGLEPGENSLVDAIYWAAGYDVPNTSKNLHPAQVIHISIPRASTLHIKKCPTRLQEAIDKVNASGSIVVTDRVQFDASKYYPSNCQRVIRVAAKGRDNILASYSGFGSDITISASTGANSRSNVICPGDKCGILFSNWDSYYDFDPNEEPKTKLSFFTFPSMATPHVSAAIANIISVFKARRETYDYNRIINILQDSASTFAEGGNCWTPEKCVPNRVLDVGKAIELVLEKDLKKDYIFVNAGMLTKHALAKCPAIVKIDNGRVDISKTGGDENCIPYDINNAKVSVLKYSYTKDYLLAGTDHGIYVCNVKDSRKLIKCNLELATPWGIDYISKPEINIDQLEEYHITIKGDDKNYIHLQFKEDMVNNSFSLYKFTKKLKNYTTRLSDSPNMDGTLVTN